MDFKQDTNLVATNWMPTVLGLTEGLFAMSVQACFKSQLPLTIGTVAVNKLKEKTYLKGDLDINELYRYPREIIFPSIYPFLEWLTKFVVQKCLEHF